MTTYFLLLYFLFSSPHQGDLLLEDLAPHMFINADGTRDRCVITYAEMVSGPKYRLFLFDLASKQGLFIEDGRMGRPSGVRTLMFEDRILVVALPFFDLPQMYAFDPSGKFIDTIRFETIKDWKESYSPIEVFRIGETLLFTVEELVVGGPPPKEDLLVQVDLKSQSAKLLYARPKKDALLTKFAPIGKEFLHINNNTGAILHLSGSSYSEKLLAPGLPLQDADTSKAKAIGIKLPTALQYHQHLKSIIPQGETVSYLRSTPSAKEEDYILQGYVMDRNGKTTLTGSDLMIWPFPNARILFEFTEKTFRLAEP